jgi:hypothetical protein
MLSLSQIGSLFGVMNPKERLIRGATRYHRLSQFVRQLASKHVEEKLVRFVPPLMHLR